MTQRFLNYIGINERYATDEIYRKLDVIETSLTAIAEGVDDSYVITTSASYTHSLIFEFLENVKAGLLELVNRILSMVNTYILNNANLVRKYHGVILDRFQSIKEPIYHTTYEYPSTIGYPEEIASGAVRKDVIDKLIEDAKNPKATPTAIGARVNHILIMYSKKIIGFPVNPYDIRDDVDRIVTDKVRGEEITVCLSYSTIDSWLKMIENYKSDREDIVRIRKNVLRDYDKLKDDCKKLTRDTDALTTDRLASYSE